MARDNPAYLKFREDFAKHQQAVRVAEIAAFTQHYLFGQDPTQDETLERAIVRAAHAKSKPVSAEDIQKVKEVIRQKLTPQTA